MALFFSSASITLSSNPLTSLLRLHGSTAIWKTRKSNTFTPINPQVPQVDIRRILSDHTCSSWYRERMLLLRFAAASSASRSATENASCVSCSATSFAWSFLYKCVNLSRSAADHACFRWRSSLTSRWEVDRRFIAAV